MKSILMKQKTGSCQNQIIHQRRGSTLLVVIALLAILALMAVVFYTLSAQEQTSAENFADAAINEADPGLQADVLFNWGLEQLIKGPDKYRKNSALWGGDYPRHSMIYNMLGTVKTSQSGVDVISMDQSPFNGQGINVILDGSNGLIVDQDYDGSADSNNLLNVNISPSASLTVPSNLSLHNNYPQPDVDYTSPDINNMFLAYKGYVPGPTWPGNLNDVQLVIIPSFHRPQYLRDNSGNPIADPYNEATISPQRVFRPHNEHHFIHRDTDTDSGSPRFNTTDFDIAGALGVWTSDADTDYTLDVDNDGDTIKEGVWLDLDFPPIEDPQNPGDYIIPLFSFTVYDTNGLIDLNTAGNMRQPGSIDLNYAPAGTFGNNTSGSGSNQFIFLSRSHQGLSSPGEINPQWALTARIPSPAGTAFNQHHMFFGAEPTTWPELSNMEYFFLNYGRPDFTVPATIDYGIKSDIRDLINGRWGEPNRLYAAQRDATGDNLVPGEFSRPGQSGVDDNGDRYEGSNQSGSLQGSRAGAISFKHPLAHNGAGRTWRSGADYRRTNLQAPFGGPATWPYYVNYEIAGPELFNTPASVRWPSALFGNPSDPARDYYLLDDSDEIVVDMEKVQRPYDDPFGPEEMAHLQLSGTDIVSSGVTSRLASLMPRNFGTTGGTDYERRKRFTTIAWDLKQFSKPVSTSGITNQFPPPYPTNPFRPELLELLGTGLPQGTISTPHQTKLNLNQLLVLENTGTGRTVSYRPLTSHPGEDSNGNGSLDTGEDLNGNTMLDLLPATAINTSWSSSSLPAYPPTTNEQQEFWARYDRQRMARDIYTLLYSLNCFTSPSSDSFTVANPYPRNYSSDEMLQMAQFAVNLVDSLDPDSVMTRFEYDTNLGDGWGLDDNPFTNTSAEQATGQRKVVWGVEAVELTLSEFTLVQCEDQMTDHAVTQFPDDKVDGTDKERFFSAIELRNNSPYTVSFGTRGKWMLGLEVDGGMVSYAIPKNKSVRAGELFTLLSSSGGDTFESGGGDPYSELRVDLDGNGDFTAAGERIIPAVAIAAGDKIDMVTDQATTQSLVTVLNDSFTDITTSAGSFLDQGRTQLAATATDVKVKLFRKAHLGRDVYVTTGTPVPDSDNPWILVDEISVPKSDFNLTSDTAAAAEAQLDRGAMKSQERSQPLHQRSDTVNTIASGNIRNTIGQQNSRTTTNFTAWQPHFDRDFSSPVELFSIPIVGPTQEIVAPQTLPVSATGPNGSNLDGSSSAGKTRRRLMTYALVDSAMQQSGIGVLDGVQTAGIQKFLNPDGENNTGPDDDDNFWFRLFEYVEVPSRIHRQLANPLKDFRVPGKLNPNTIRDPSVLAALIDDMGTTSSVLDGGAYNTDVTNAYKIHRLNDTSEGSARNWWAEFIRSRDAVDPIANIELPGTPGSRPFRSFDFFGSRNAATTGVRDLRENSLFRSLPTDISSGHVDDPRLLFEVATRSDHENGPADFHSRNRILSKIMGNMTTRSNTFTVFMSVAYFEASGAGLTAHDDVVQIGDRAHGKSVHVPDYRGFFVVDRTRVEEAYEPTTKKYDNWKRLVRYRHLIQSIQED
ncbi:hypothetical protein [Gimesia algae]|uniref:Uncharacterized protein n=1 Tax=Gimesia algae TaxID=2527971 RepID=A0A517VL73_9PLAN|nr:hypothetical protein [Gimesia algae]QDT93763.1 hypothetical protein Pan161_54480 [Gimesia algae]